MEQQSSDRGVFLSPIRIAWICAGWVLFFGCMAAVLGSFRLYLGIFLSLAAACVGGLAGYRYYGKLLRSNLELVRACRTRLLEKLLSGDVPPEGDLTVALPGCQSDYFAVAELQCIDFSGYLPECGDEHIPHTEFLQVDLWMREYVSARLMPRCLPYFVPAPDGMEILINSFYQIFDIRDPDEQLAIDSLRTQIERGLLDSPYIKLVSSEAVENAKRKGQLNPADVYLIGEVTYFDIDDSKSEERKLVKAAKGDQKAEYEIVRYWKRTAYFNFKYQVVDSYTDKVISFDEVRMQETSSRYESKKSLPSAYTLLESDIRAASKRILQELQPYVVTKSIKLLEVKTKDKELKARMKAADELAKNNQIQTASSEFQKIYEETGTVEAGYNAAILQEALGNLSVAEKMMQDVYLNNPDSRVAKGLADIQSEINMANRLKNQIKDSAAGSDDSDDYDDIDF